MKEASTDTSSHAAAASVTLDIGAGRGALVLYPGERFRGREIEISGAGEAHRTHTGVHERFTATGPVLTAIFGSLPAGEYLVWESTDVPAASVTVPDGAFAEVTLR
jgi:hypothetical protein